MPRNIELKARVANLEPIAARLAAMHCPQRDLLLQIDTFFHVNQGRLKLREFDDGAGELIYYERANQTGAKLSQYDRIPCEDPKVILRALSAALGVRGVVRKRRRLHCVDRTRIHLDQVDGLGSFIELEVVLETHEPVSSGERVATDLLHALGIPSAALVTSAYIDLLEQSATGIS